MRQKSLFLVITLALAGLSSLAAAVQVTQKRQPCSPGGPSNNPDPQNCPTATPPCTGEPSCPDQFESFTYTDGACLSETPAKCSEITSSGPAQRWVNCDCDTTTGNCAPKDPLDQYDTGSRSYTDC